ncbi:MAG: 6,7-dimethyl-8-ribityllumazine synthase [Bdellovibrionales bacterium]
MKIGVITAEFNSRYTYALRDGAVEALVEKGVAKENIIMKSVPGAFELPIVAKNLILNHGVDGVLCYGVVIRGETDHYDYVCGAAADGCLQVGLETLKPVQFGVLTVDTHKQLFDRIWGKKGNKGREVALGLLDTLEAMK